MTTHEKIIKSRLCRAICIECNGPDKDPLVLQSVYSTFGRFSQLIPKHLIIWYTMRVKIGVVVDEFNAVSMILRYIFLVDIGVTVFGCKTP